MSSVVCQSYIRCRMSDVSLLSDAVCQMSVLYQMLYVRCQSYIRCRMSDVSLIPDVTQLFNMPTAIQHACI